MCGCVIQTRRRWSYFRLLPFDVFLMSGQDLCETHHHTFYISLLHKRRSNEERKSRTRISPAGKLHTLFRNIHQSVTSPCCVLYDLTPLSLSISLTFSLDQPFWTLHSPCTLMCMLVWQEKQERIQSAPTAESLSQKKHSSVFILTH